MNHFRTGIWTFVNLDCQFYATLFLKFCQHSTLPLVVNILCYSFTFGPNGAGDNCKFEFDYGKRRKGQANMIVVVMKKNNNHELCSIERGRSTAYMFMLGDIYDVCGAPCSKKQIVQVHPQAPACRRAGRTAWMRPPVKAAPDGPQPAGAHATTHRRIGYGRRC